MKCENSETFTSLSFEENQKFTTMKPKLNLTSGMSLRVGFLCMWVVFSASLNTRVSAGNGGSSDCPAECSCSSSGVVVDCSNRGLTRIPSPLPKETVTL